MHKGREINETRISGNFSPLENSESYLVTVPDLPGCVTTGKDLADALDMTIDAASGWVLTEVEDGNPVPEASPVNRIQFEDDESFISVISLDMAAYAAKYGSKSVRKNTTIPVWMDTFIAKNDLSISKNLQDAVMQLYSQQQTA